MRFWKLLVLSLWLLCSCEKNEAVQGNKILRLAHNLPETHVVHQAMTFMAERIHEKLSFYEVKPTGKGNESLLKVSQAKWIKKNCLGKKIDVYLVRYKSRTNKFTFTKWKLNKNNIGMYEPS